MGWRLDVLRDARAPIGSEDADGLVKISRGTWTHPRLVGLEGDDLVSELAHILYEADHGHPYVPKAQRTKQEGAA